MVGNRHVPIDMSLKKKEKRNKMSDWKFLSLDYQPNDWTQESIRPLNSLSVTEQECALIEDLLFVLIVCLFKLNVI